MNENRALKEARGLDVCCCHSCDGVLPGASAFYYWGLMAYLPSPISAVARKRSLGDHAELRQEGAREGAGGRERATEKQPTS